MSCEKNGLSFSKNEHLNTYYNNLVSIYDKNSSSFEKIVDFPKYAPTNAITEFIARYELVKLIKGIPGDIFEMGVCGGRGLFSFHHSLYITEPKYEFREIVGFDTFSGIQGVSEKDNNNYRTINNGEFSFSNIDELNELKNIHGEYINNWFNKDRIHLIKGDIMQTLPQYIDDNKHKLVALLYLDMDIYEPTKFALDILLPRMSKGSIIAFDELYYKSFPGETIALLEKFNINNYKIHNLLNTRINYIIL